MRIIFFILSIVPFMYFAVPSYVRDYCGADFLFCSLSDVFAAGIMETDEDDTDDNETDNTTGDDTEDNETVKHLKEMFDNATDFSVCEHKSDILKFPEGTYFERCVREYIGDKRWPISCEHASEIKIIKCNDPRITSLEGVQQFPNLETLDTGPRGTEISDLMPLRNLKRLKRLEIPNSKITNIEYLTRLPHLTALNLKGNSVTDLTYLPYMSPIYQLALDYQGPDYITDIEPMKYMSESLQNLTLQGNKITDISPLAHFHALQYLSIRDNRITDISALDNKTLLAGLEMSINRITDISPLDNNTSLSVIYADHNNISDISPLENLYKITQVSFKHNNISDISPVANKRKMKSMVFDFNIIEDVSPIYDISITSDILSLRFTYNCIPKENYRKIRFLYNIQDVHFENQCENYPPEDVFIQGETIVNEDIITGEFWETDNTTIIPKHHETIGSGCSIGQKGETSGDIVMTAFGITLAFAIIRRFKYGGK